MDIDVCSLTWAYRLYFTIGLFFSIGLPFGASARAGPGRKAATLGIGVCSLTWACVQSFSRLDTANGREVSALLL
jgi:hypothetical protein